MHRFVTVEYEIFNSLWAYRHSAWERKFPFITKCSTRDKYLIDILVPLNAHKTNQQRKIKPKDHFLITVRKFQTYLKGLLKQARQLSWGHPKGFIENERLTGKIKKIGYMARAMLIESQPKRAKMIAKQGERIQLNIIDIDGRSMVKRISELFNSINDGIEQLGSPELIYIKEVIK